MAYNSVTPATMPKMHSLVQALWEGAPHTQWALHHDPTCETNNTPWGIELISPLLRSYPDSAWRDQVKAIWHFLLQRYIVSGNVNCSTHVHISLSRGFTVSDLKSIAQAIIHFEPAFEVLVPTERRGNEYARSNWIDNPNFGYRNFSRQQSIDLVERLRTADEVIDIMNPNQSKYFGWNFLSIKTYRTIEFRRGAVSLSADDVLMWAELAMSFILAAVTPRHDRLQQYPASVGGLKAFILKASLRSSPGMHDSSLLDRLFHGIAPSAALQPTPVGRLSVEKTAKLQRKIAADCARNPMLDVIYSAQQYGVA
ncbi:uncharacterized protein N7515_002732 [Penicillium bovifimosum]|uniref:Amidoligase enzyme n=1 Tax=Penicillium bovifimosum TaxID=126998 RepID=A0A9W9HC29_9EURO|nr:uncharacterized protein N7515_002732 [Penicillium bovifimosum]KAJ5143945.1 hypothetical protein N7515_002732 [Penicillium bovifimosum]